MNNTHSQYVPTMSGELIMPTTSKCFLKFTEQQTPEQYLSNHDQNQYNNDSSLFWPSSKLLTTSTDT